MLRQIAQFGYFILGRAVPAAGVTFPALAAVLALFGAFLTLVHWLVWSYQ